jgi:hypothetical protein
MKSVPWNLQFYRRHSTIDILRFGFQLECKSQRGLKAEAVPAPASAPSSAPDSFSATNGPTLSPEVAPSSFLKRRLCQYSHGLFPVPLARLCRCDKCVCFVGIQDARVLSDICHFQ